MSFFFFSPLLCCTECSGFLLLSLFSMFLPMPQGLVPAPVANCFCLQVTCASCCHATPCPSENPLTPFSPLTVRQCASSSSLSLFKPSQLCKSHNIGCHCFGGFSVGPFNIGEAFNIGEHNLDVAEQAGFRAVF